MAASVRMLYFHASDLILVVNGGKTLKLIDSFLIRPIPGKSKVIGI
jgi:hypothetical protein